MTVPSTARHKYTPIRMFLLNKVRPIGFGAIYTSVVSTADKVQ